MVSGTGLFFSLFNNLAIFVALVYVYGYLYVHLQRTNKYLRQLINGLSFGLFAIGCMFAKIPVFEGVVVDQRNAIIAISAAFGGPLSAAVSVIMAGAFRVYLGGSGVISGLTGLALAAAAGSVLYKIPGSFRTVTRSIISAFAATLIINLGWLMYKDIQTGWNSLKAVGLPFGGAIFLGIFLVALLLKREERRHQIEFDFRESEEKYRVLFESFPLALVITDREGKVVETNAVGEQKKDIMQAGKPGSSNDETEIKRIRPDGSIISPEEYITNKALAENKKISNMEIGYVKGDEAPAWISITAAPIPLEKYGIAVAYIDITDKKNAELKMREALREKTVLLQELYHRTKNNMLVIISLIDSQIYHSDDPAAGEMLQETINRIHSMALVHEKLYQSEDLSHLNLADYIRDLAEWLFYTYEFAGNTVELEYDLDDIIALIDTAIPCGLIVVELLTNTLKHAFPGTDTGIIRIGLKRNSEGVIRLTVADNGKGFPEGFDYRQDSRLGIQTVLALAEGQLKGSVEYKGDRGVTFSLHFTDDLYFARV